MARDAKEKTLRFIHAKWLNGILCRTQCQVNASFVGPHFSGSRLPLGERPARVAHTSLSSVRGFSSFSFPLSLAILTAVRSTFSREKETLSKPLYPNDLSALPILFH